MDAASMHDDEAFLTRVTRRLAGLPGVVAVGLGGSRAQFTHTDASDWDLGLYYRGPFDPQHLRDLGWEGEASELGGWGGGVFNGGAWLSVEGRRVDVHYRDLDVVEAEIDRAHRGEFDVEPLMFHLAGIPSYLIVAEVALGRTLHGAVPMVDGYPETLRRSAARRWSGQAEATLGYAAANHMAPERLTQLLGLVAVGACQYAHAILAARGQWATNDKRLLHSAGLTGIAPGDGADPAALIARVRAEGRALLEEAG